MAEKSAVEQLAEMELQRRRREAVRPLAESIHAQCEQEQAEHQKANDALAAAYKAKKEKERAQEQARQEYEEREKAEKPQRIHDAYASFLHQLEGED